MVQSGEVGIEEAARLVQSLQLDPESHVVAAVMAWRYRPSSAERAAWDTFEMELNTRRKRGQVPIKLKRPWEVTSTQATVPTVALDDPERLAALERLKANS